MTQQIATSIPESIPLTDIVFELEHLPRERKEYNNIESLAESIALTGTQTPIVLSPLPDGKWLLEAGGRRYTALKQLAATTVYYGSVANPGRPGFVVKNRVTTTEDHSLTELIENLHRENLTWQEEVRLLVKAYRAKKHEGNLAGVSIHQVAFGNMIGVPAADIKAACLVHDRLIAEPSFFSDCSTVFVAYKKLLNESRQALEKELAGRAMKPVVPVDSQPKPDKNLTDFVEKLSQEPGIGEIRVLENEYVQPPVPVVPLSNRLFNVNSLDWMESYTGPKFDHIICDPDFAISVERLNSNSGNMGSGVIQESIEDSLADLYRFLPLAHKVTGNGAFLLFFYDLDHQEKLQKAANDAGWGTQRWPIIWHKTDYFSNSAPYKNTTKNIEYVMLCRKTDANLTSVQKSSIISLPSGNVVDQFGHPFAKPAELWKRLFSMVATPGQRVLDPFAGRGSSTLAAIQYGLEPTACELNSIHFNPLVLNVQKEYKSKLGPATLFS